MAACVAWTMVRKSRPLMMSLLDRHYPLGNTRLRAKLFANVGQNSANVLAMLNLYRLPAFEPLAATPPGKGSTTPAPQQRQQLPVPLEQGPLGTRSHEPEITAHQTITIANAVLDRDLPGESESPSIFRPKR